MTEDDVRRLLRDALIDAGRPKTSGEIARVVGERLKELSKLGELPADAVEVLAVTEAPIPLAERLVVALGPDEALWRAGELQLGLVTESLSETSFAGVARRLPDARWSYWRGLGRLRPATFLRLAWNLQAPYTVLGELERAPDLSARGVSFWCAPTDPDAGKLKVRMQLRRPVNFITMRFEKEQP